ncbi:type II toxin-antitoxin system HicA family toxin [Planctomicrobium piriforme]|uniref:type II toxin-antitoxin system HicA family toxin n=1 Tax=Planctomicrobium piriforme TaxID=1576369 RepID=UPI0036F20D81
MPGRTARQRSIRSDPAGDHQRPPCRGRHLSGLPVLKPRELIRALEKAGFRVVRKSAGSHWQLAHDDGRRTTVPVHKGRDIGPGLLRKILRDTELTIDQLKQLISE